MPIDSSLIQPNQDPNQSALLSNAIKMLLKQSQSLGTAGFREQELQGREQQIRRSIYSDPSLSLAPRGVQEGVRSANVSALNPSIQSARESGQTFGEQLQGFRSIAHDILSTEATQQDKLKTEAREIISQALTNFGSKAFDMIDPKYWKIAGYTDDARNKAKETLKEQEIEKKLSAAPKTINSSEGILTWNDKTQRYEKTGFQPPIKKGGGSGGGDVITIDQIVKKYPLGTKQFKVAQDLAYGRLRFQDFRTLYAYSRDIEAKTNIYALASALNPNFNPSQFELGYVIAANPKIIQQLSALDNVQYRIPDLLKISDQASRSGITALNKIINPSGYLIGNRKYTNFSVATKAFADELSGALGFGTASDMKLQLGIDIADKNLSPENFSSAINDVILPFVQSKRQSFVNQMGIYGSTRDQFSQGQNTQPQTMRIGKDTYILNPQTGKYIKR